MSKRKTHEEYVKELAIKNPNIEVIGQYIDAKTKIKHYCKKHNIFWETNPSNVLNGHGCRMCGNNMIKTQEQYVNEVANINPNIEVIGKYINARTKIEHRCKVDGYVWNTQPYVILRGDGCPKCAGNAKRTQKEYIDEVFAVNPNIEILEKYINSNTPILHKCKIDGYEWSIAPINVLLGRGCPACKNKKLSDMFSKSHEQYVLEASVVNPDLAVVGTYVNAKTPILHRCKKDGYTWKITPSNVLSGQKCPVCQESLGERKIRQLLESNNILYIYQKIFEDCVDKKELPFDFYLPQYNLCIEYDGQQHFEPVDFAGNGEEWAEKKLSLTQHHDQIKNQYCQANNIKLLRIPYFKNIEEELNKFLFI